MPIIETVRGLAAVEEIAGAPSALGVLFGPGDLALELGCATDWEPLLYARSRTIHAARLAGKYALDGPFFDVGDQEGLASEAARAQALGFRKSPPACNSMPIRKLGLKTYPHQTLYAKTNVKAERFIQTALREWAYARAYRTSDQRAENLPVWTHMYNWHRPHGSLNSKTPISRIGQSGDNLLRLHS